MVFYEPILKSGIRVLRPGEAKMLMASIPKIEYKVMFQALLYTGLRYIEAQRLTKEWYRKLLAKSISNCISEYISVRNK